MPELPEVETTCRGIAPYLRDRIIRRVIVRQRQLRCPVPRQLNSKLAGQAVVNVTRRAKYLLITLHSGTLILHLGMSGSLRILPADAAAQKHDHLDIMLDNGRCLRLTDPRRFGAVLWTEQDPLQHPLLQPLGPEPLDRNFSGRYLHLQAQGRKMAVKQFLMDSRIVAGLGNIYASEALFLSGIRPDTPAGTISLARYEQLTRAVKQVLKAAIKQGGTNLRDFVASDGRPGYFKQHLKVYDRQGEPCRVCGTKIRQIRQGQRSSYFCPSCQH